MWKYIRLKASTSKLLEKKNFIQISYYEAQIKSGGFSSRKQNEVNLK